MYIFVNDKMSSENTKPTAEEANNLVNNNIETSSSSASSTSSSSSSSSTSTASSTSLGNSGSSVTVNTNIKNFKTLSISSTDSLCSSNDINEKFNDDNQIIINQKFELPSSTAKIISQTSDTDREIEYLGSSKSRPSIPGLDKQFNENFLNFDQTNKDEEMFDFAKTGAKPKKKTTNPNSKSSLSSSTSSSLSSLSLISQHSNAPSSSSGLISTNSSSSSSSQSKSTNSKSKKKSSTTNHHQLNYYEYGQKQSSSLNNKFSNLNANYDLNNDEDYDDLNLPDSSSGSSSSKMKISSSSSKYNPFTNSNTRNCGANHQQQDEENEKILNDFTDLITCPLCYKLVKSNLELHFEQEHREYECPMCGLLFDNDFVLNQHFNLVHNDDSSHNNNINNNSNSNKRDDFNTATTTTTTTSSSSLPFKPFEATANRSTKSGLGSGSRASGATSLWPEDDSIDDLDQVEILSGSGIEEKNKLVCPVCMAVIKEGIEFLEMHVDSHFSQPTTNDSNDLKFGPLLHESSSSNKNKESNENQQLMAGAMGENKCSSGPVFPGTSYSPIMFSFENKFSNKSRTQSASSLTANVDENFELDQVMTLTECDMTDYETFNISSSNNSLANQQQQQQQSKFDHFFLNQNNLNDNFDNTNTYQNERIDSRKEFTSNSPVMLTDDSSMEKTDYEIALLLDKEEKEKFRKLNSENIAILQNNNTRSALIPNTSLNTNRQLNQKNDDFLNAQIRERQQNESLKYKLSKENQAENIYDEDYAIELSYDNQSDSEYAAELEHEWLKQKYGMSNIKASTKAITNLDRALKMNKIDVLTYHHEKDQIETRINSIYDDDSTCNKDLIELIASVPLNKNVSKRLICTNCDHYSSSYIDTGYGCGYRNAQILLSSIREDPSLRDIVFNNNNRNMPSITKIQEIIENAWNNGFDLMGKNQLGGQLKNSAKWIGASDICAMLLSLRIKAELVDIKLNGNSKTSVASVLFRFVKNYFEEETNSGRYIHPIYLQHDGHSRTIVGIELGKNENLLLFDPGTRRNQIEMFRLNKIKSMHIFRRSMAAFKKKEYQLLLIRGAIKTNEEYNNSKVLTSKKISS